MRYALNSDGSTMPDTKLVDEILIWGEWYDDETQRLVLGWSAS